MLMGELWGLRRLTGDSVPNIPTTTSPSLTTIRPGKPSKFLLQTSIIYGTQRKIHVYRAFATALQLNNNFLPQLLAQFPTLFVNQPRWNNIPGINVSSSLYEVDGCTYCLISQSLTNLP
jgi:hypothetical protein